MPKEVKELLPSLHRLRDRVPLIDVTGRATVRDAQTAIHAAWLSVNADARLLIRRRVTADGADNQLE